MGAQAPLRLPAAPPLAVCGYTSVLLLFAFCLPESRASNQPAGGGGDCPGGRGKNINCSGRSGGRRPLGLLPSAALGREDPCHTNYIPVCGSNGDTYQNECFLRRAACKHQKDITVVARGPCYSDNGSGSGEGDCSGYSFNPVCASDGSSYNNPCFVREASCIKQEQIDIRHLGHCTDTDDTSLLGKKDDGLQYRPDVKDAGDQREDVYIGSHMPCPENLNGYCIHGKCEFVYSTQKASCRCESGYTGQHCEKTDFSILYVVPSRQKLTHVLIAAIIGAVQIAIIVAIVMCITRKCPKNNRGRRQKQNLGHFTSDTSSRMV
ncbi:Tmeff1 [Phodopus roborovskii]|uniref:Tomoregulin-1 n=1 Tax=Phodopus roborovskii TaxID=109678 RepID=A0AAU9ZGG9_PHORO|nr:Tmeff1 [Phodopus roborovskii]